MRTPSICETRATQVIFRSYTTGRFWGLVILLSLLLLTAQTRGYAQSDSLITIEGKVLVGKYKKPVFGHSSFVSDGKKLVLDPERYAAYKSGDTWYGSVRVAAQLKPVWMQCLERGAITLYQYVQFAGSPKKSARSLPESQVVWLASKKGGQVLNVNGVMASTAQAKDNLKRLLIDEPSLSNEVDSAPFTPGVIRALIEGYNRRAAAR